MPRGAAAPTLYEAVGCESCGHRGYQGRTGIYELLEIDERMRAMIHDGAPEQDVERYARGRSKSIHQDGIQRVLDGVTTLEEILRVTRDVD